MRPISVDIIIPTLDRPSLGTLLAALTAGWSDALARRLRRAPRILMIDDRKQQAAALSIQDSLWRLPFQVDMFAGKARGPAAARNIGWHQSDADWIEFLDDDVVPQQAWWSDLIFDLTDANHNLGASQGRVRVPLPSHRRPTDWERNVAGLENARWITADMAYRRRALLEAGGFNERFPRAFREDSDLALRTLALGYSIVKGQRTIEHPVRQADRWISLRLEAGNADNVLMRALHGKRWHLAAGASLERFPMHLAIAACGGLAVAAWLARKKRLSRVAALLCLGGTLEFAWSRISPGPKDAAEISTLLLTSAVIPFAASYHWLRGWVVHRELFSSGARLGGAGNDRSPGVASIGKLPAAVLLDRDGTLVADVPANAEPYLVEAMPGAREALARLREAGIAMAVISNQSAVAAGSISLEELRTVNARIEEMLGPLGPWFVCTHAEADRCACRKPAPGLILRAATALGVRPQECVVIGDVGSDMQAARAAGASAVLVPTRVTKQEEIAAAPLVARDLQSAIDLILSCRA